MSDSGGIGWRVRAARERLGWTREALSFHCGLSWSAIAQVESGRRTNVRPATLAALSRSLGVSIDYLVEGRPSHPTMLEHSVFTYGSEQEYRTIVGPFLARGIERSEAVIVVTTSANIELLRDYLGNDATGVEFVDSSGFLSTPFAALESYRAFFDTRLAGGAPWVRVLGEPIWADRSEAEIGLWTQFESLLNVMFSAYPLTAVCPYDERSVASEIVRNAYLTHPYTLGEHGISESPAYAEPGRFALGG